MLRQLRAAMPNTAILPPQIRHALKTSPVVASGFDLARFPLVYVLSEGRRFYGFLERLPTGALFHRPGLQFPLIEAQSYKVLAVLN